MTFTYFIVNKDNTIQPKEYQSLKIATKDLYTGQKLYSYLKNDLAQLCGYSSHTHFEMDGTKEDPIKARKIWEKQVIADYKLNKTI
jgi:hypothetical protein